MSYPKRPWILKVGFFLELHSLISALHILIVIKGIMCSTFIYYPYGLGFYEKSLKNYYGLWISWIFSIITPVFSVTWSFRNHRNMLIWVCVHFYKYTFFSNQKHLHRKNYLTSTWNSILKGIVHPKIKILSFITHITTRHYCCFLSAQKVFL